MQNQAYKILDELKIVEEWENIGAKVNMIGSLKMGLLVKHRDIDFHIYTDELDNYVVQNLIERFKASKIVKKVDFIDLSEADDCCFEIHLWVESDDSKLWQIDMINIKKGSKYDGFFEKMTDEILEIMTEEQKQTILNLKFQTPENIKIAGMEYYKAVIQDGVKTYDALLDWRCQHKFDGIIEW